MIFQYTFSLVLSPYKHTPISYTFFFNFYSFLSKKKNDPMGTPLQWPDSMIELVSVQKDS